MDFKAANALINCLDDDHEIQNGVTVKDIAYSTLVGMGEEIVELLTDYLKKNQGKGDLSVNQQVAKLLLDICRVYGNKTPYELFMENAKKDSEFRLESIAALGYIGDKSSYELLVDMIKDNRLDVLFVVNVASSLKKLSKIYGEQRTLDILTDILNSLKYTGNESINEDIVLLKNNIIDAINEIVNKNQPGTIGDFINYSQS